ncbi:MAG: hypothetical protein L6R39_000617 [Caloplaca ligustica]|nr:MAG: hypothetical protein L6R39_000617 [Caloplaca ligustica]
MLSRGKPNLYSKHSITSSIATVRYQVARFSITYQLSSHPKTRAMLSRGNSEASARLRRAKSSTSIKARRPLSSEPSVLDPFAAKEYALAAASHAFGRATTSDLTSRASQYFATSHRTSDSERPLTRSKSIRFAGPTALPGREQPITMREAPAIRSDGETHRTSLHPDFRRNNSSIQGDDAFMTALPSHTEYVETHPASQPSSYRRLRKSKSMFTPRALSTSTSSTALKIQTFERRSYERAGQPRTELGSRSSRSFSFIRPHPIQIPSNAATGQTSQNEAIGLARDQYLRQLERQNLDGNPMIANAALRRQSQKAFRKTVRTSSRNIHGASIEGAKCPQQDRLEHRGVGSKARDLSSSFKNRLKRVFNRSSEAEGTLPAQHLQATRLHFGDATAPYVLSETQGQSIESLDHSTPDRSSLQRSDTLHVSRCRDPLASPTPRGADGLDIDDNKSRVTSWTNSTAANTLTLHQGSGRKRLSVIQETGNVPLHLGFPGPSGSLQPVISAAGDQPRRSSLYTKLQQRISRGNSSTQLQPPRHDACNTGMPLAEESNVSSLGPLETSETLNPPGGDQARSAMTPIQPPAHNAEDQSLLPQDSKVLRTEVQVHKLGDAQPKGPLRESKSMFFPQSTRIERSSPSPFRQAMRHNGLSEMHNPRNISPSPAVRHETRDRSQARSESIYSRTSSGNTPQGHKNLEYHTKIDKDGDTPTAALLSATALEGNTTVTEAMTDPSPEPRLPLAREDSPRDQMSSVHSKKISGHRREHAQISGEDTDVGKLQLSTSMPKSSPTGGPVGLDVRCLIRRTPPQPMVDRFPLISIKAQTKANRQGSKAPVSTKTATRPTAETVGQRPLDRSYRSRENMNPKQSATSLPSPSSDRNTYSKQQGGGKHDKTGLHMSLQQGNSLTVSTPMSHSRSSPERIARLRRMYSSHTLGSPGSRKSVEPSPEVHRNMYRAEIQEVRDIGMGLANREGDPPGGGFDLVPGGRKMVDVFLETRSRSSRDDTEGTVFI